MFTTRRPKLAPRSIPLLLLLLLALSLPALMPRAHSEHTPAPTTVAVAGSMQSELGCPGDWQPECAESHLMPDADDGIWQRNLTIPAGSYEYKAALNNGWDENYGAGARPGGTNIGLSLTDTTTVKFYYDHESHWITDNRNTVIATVVGSFQGELGCPADWTADCLRSWLQDPEGDGLYTFATTGIPTGTYEAKVAIDESVDEQYGQGGVLHGESYTFTVSYQPQEIYFAYDAESRLLTISEAGAPRGNLQEARAHWLSEETIAWTPQTEESAVTYKLHYDPSGEMAIEPGRIVGGQVVTLTVDTDGLSPELQERFPHVAGQTALKIPASALDQVPSILKGQIAISAYDERGKLLDATSLQIPGVLDDLYTYEGELGVIWEGEIPTLKLWAPTARSVTLHLFDDSDPATTSNEVPMHYDAETGVWSVTGSTAWDRKFYLYEVEVFVRTTGQVERNLVTDPYSHSLSTNSRRSQIVNLFDPELMPDGWEQVEKPYYGSPENIVVYELHVRDFSVNDPSVSSENRGKFTAFTEEASHGMQHLRALAAAGVTHLHLLPVFDIATINENAAEREEADWSELSALPPDSEQQQAIIGAIRDQDAFNWGYDPYHYTVPEGSYSTDPDGTTRIVEFRQMVQSLNQSGLRVVMDVVYNHTNASGQAERSVLDRIVPGYYHRLDEAGNVTTSTCCENTATEHNMMEKLMVDSVVTWATAYKVDGFRFDLMGHHMVRNMIRVRERLNALTETTEGVDGREIYIYGEGWNFGEVADNARGENATQLNMGGTGIGTFNDRLRDGARGGSPFSNPQFQGFLTGLYYDPNSVDQGSEAEQKTRLLHAQDLIRVGLAGNLQDYTFVDSSGETVKGSDVLYNGQPAGYTLDPQENIVYVSAHDNETLFDAIQLKAPRETTMAERVRMQNLGLSLVALSQGISFFHAGSDMLRSKSMDRDSYNSGDWFNKLDFTYESNNWGVGLPGAWVGSNQENWPIMQPLLADPALKPAKEDILDSVEHFREVMRLSKSSPLFRLEGAEEIMERLTFYNTGPEQLPGLIVMAISDTAGVDLDFNYERIVVLFNANDEAQTFSEVQFEGLDLELHPIQQESADPVVKESRFDSETGAFTIPARTMAVFVQRDTDQRLFLPLSLQVSGLPGDQPAALFLPILRREE